MRIALPPIALAALLLVPRAEALPPGFTIEPKGDHEVRVEGNTAVVDIRSKRGIGRTTLAVKDGDWPAKVILRLHLKGLEGFELSAGDKKLKTFVSSQKNAPPAPGQLKVKLVPEKGAEAKVPLKGYFEIEVPADLLKAKPENLKLHWVDFYRG